jgi:hypothetical protein
VSGGAGVGGGRGGPERRNWIVIAAAILATLVVIGAILVSISRGTFF